MLLGFLIYVHAMSYERLTTFLEMIRAKKFVCEVSSICTRVRKFQLDVFSAFPVFESSNASTIYFVVARTGIREFLATSKSVVSWSECEWMRKYSYVVRSNIAFHRNGFGTSKLHEKMKER